jgi:multidrug efflux system membrane fusion protein
MMTAPRTWHDRCRTAGAAAALLALAGLYSSGCSEPGAGAAADQRRQRVVPVRAATAAVRDIPIQLRAIGTVEAYASVSIKSRVEGQVAEVHFLEGQEVTKGARLFTIDPRPFEAALREAEANLLRAQSEAQNARVEAERMVKLLEQRIVSQDEHDTAQTRAASLRAMVTADEAAVDKAKLDLLYCHISSPIDGRIGQILVHQGNVVNPDETTLAVVNQIRPIYVGFSVPQQELSEIRHRVADERLLVEVYPGKHHDRATVGELSFINNQVDTDTGTVLLKGLFANDDEQLWPGQFVDTVVTLAVQRDAVVVPSEAVQTGQQGQYVFTIGPGQTVELRPVRTGEDLGAEIVIAEGLRAGERVVTDGQLQLAPGMTVEVKSDEPEPAAAPSQAG